MKLSNRLLGTFLGCVLVGSSAWCEQAKTSPNFSYSGDTGPGFWGEINPACEAKPNSRQSPVDIREVLEDRQLTALDVLTSETSFTLTNPGYTVMATAHSGGNLSLNGTSFSLVQFHFHTLSEHTISGKHYAMELHAVFQDASSDLAVIGVLYSVGRPNSFLSKILKAGLPEKTTSPASTVDGLNLSDAFTDTSSYYTYPGSLTTPPCSEKVTWLVLKQEAQMSASQFESFRKVLGNDFRPQQALNDRVVRGTPRRRSSGGADAN